MTRWAPAASLRSSRSHSVAASCGGRVERAGDRERRLLPIAEPAWSSPRLRRVRISIRPIESTSQTPGAGGVVADARRVAGQREDVADAERVRAQQLGLERHEVPVAGRRVDDALEVEVVLDPERDGHRAHPDPRHRRVADVDDVGAGVAQQPRGLERALDPDAPRRVDLDREHEPPVGERVGEPRSGAAARRSSAASANAVRGARARASESRRVGRRSAAGARAARRASAVPSASSAARIAAMCAGVVPQQPPTIRAPASSSRGTIEPK